VSTVSDHKFAALQTKLRQLFELDKSDLDFGIYRIINARNKEITAFLERQLKDEVRRTLEEHGATATDQIQQELDAAIAQATELGADPEKARKVQELRARLAAAGPSSIAALEAEIYNHLLVFFGRYYEEGDFIARRRYKGDTYAIPYSGEEVTMYWANKDQYYIKSGEWHRDYRFKVGERTVRFKVVAATQETGNNKERDDAKRRFIVEVDNPIEATEAELVIRFQFRVPTAEEYLTVEANESTRIFGGGYDKPKGRKVGSEVERFCAHAETQALAAMPPEWRQRVAAGAGTEDKPSRTLLGKHLAEFTARNTFDYFIHKDLGGFLSRELDFYIKNEVVRLDDLERLPPDHLARVQGRVKAIRRVAGRIIGLLAAIENFQKKMWLKKKFVLNTSWLITVDRIPAHLCDVVAANKAQWEEWERLGFKPEAGDEGLFGGAAWGTREYLQRSDRLPVDTRLFSLAHSTALLTAATPQPVDTHASGLLVWGDAFHSMRLLRLTYQSRVDQTYLDPPYNAKYSAVLYKNTFRHAAWMSMMSDRLHSARHLARSDSVLTIAIDENEQERLGLLLDHMYPLWNRTCVSIIHNHGGIQGSNFSYCHEYAFFVFPADGQYIGTLEREEADVTPLRDWGGSTSLRESARNCFYPIIVRGSDVVAFGDVCEESFHPIASEVNLGDGSFAIYPIDGEGRERKWRFSRDTVESIKDELQCDVVKGERVVRRRKAAYRFKTVWTDSRYNANTHGSRLLADLMGGTLFAFPKSLYNTLDCVHAATQDRPHGLIMDFFAGSGTAAHAVIELNRRYGSHRKWLLVEAGAHFATVLRPRVAKCLFSPDWQAGRAARHDAGLSALVKCIALEAYDDAMAGLESTPDDGGVLSAALLNDTTIRYALDLELGPRLLDLDAFKDPWGYTINAQLAGDPEIRPHSVDLVETFNYLIGLKVSAYGPMERFSAEFERAEHPDGLGRLRVKGRLQRDPDGPFAYQRVEGELNDGRDTRVLVIWRTLSGDPEQDAAVLEAWMDKYGEDTKERSAYRDHELIYVNGPVTLPQPTASMRTVHSLEETFQARMFEDTGDD